MEIWHSPTRCQLWQRKVDPETAGDSAVETFGDELLNQQHPTTFEFVLWDSSVMRYVIKVCYDDILIQAHCLVHHHVNGIATRIRLRLEPTGDQQGCWKYMMINVLESSSTYQVHPVVQVHSKILVQFHPKSLVDGEKFREILGPCGRKLAHSWLAWPLVSGAQRRSMDGSEEELECPGIYLIYVDRSRIILQYSISTEYPYIIRIFYPLNIHIINGGSELKRTTLYLSPPVANSAAPEESETIEFVRSQEVF